MAALDEVVFHMFAARGVTVDRDGLLVRIPGVTAPNPISDAQIRFFNERKGEHEIESRLKCYWVNDLAEMAEELHRQGEAAPWAYRTAFYIRLHGVLHDERQNLIGIFRTAGIDPATYVPNQGSALAFGLEKFRHIESLRQAFSEDELIYADYLRQTNGHPTQAQYTVRWSNANGGQVNDRRRITTTGREFTSAELDAAVRRVLEAHLVNGRPNEYLIATVFARRVREVIRPLVEFMQRSILPV
jgi:hypothetical protein